MDKVALLAMAGLFTAPFVVPIHALPITSFYSEWWAGLFGVLTLSFWLSTRGTPQVSLPQPVWLLLALATLILMQMGFGRVVYPSQGGLAVFALLWAAALMVTARAMADIHGLEKLVTVLAWAALGGGLLNAVFGLFQAYGLHTGPTDVFIAYGDGGAVTGNVGQRNSYADYLCIALTGTLYLAYRNKIPWLLAYAVSLMLVIGIALSASRSAWFFLLAVLLLALVLGKTHRGQGNRALIWSLVLMLVAFQILQLVLANHGLTTANERLQVGLQGSDAGPGFSARIALLREAWQMFTTHPWFGVGFQNFAWNHFELVRSGESLFAGHTSYEATRWNHAHNIVLHLMAEFGFAGLVIVAAAMWWLLRVMRGIASIEQWCLASMISIVCIHSMLEYPLWNVHFLGIFAVLIGLADNRPMKIGLPASSTRRLGWFVSFLGVVLLSFHLMTYTALERAVGLLGMVSRDKAMLHAFRTAFDDAQMNPFLDPHIENLLSQLLASDAASPAFVAMQLSLNQRVMRYAANASPIYYRTTLLWQAGRHQEAEEWLTGAAKAYPGTLKRYLTRMEQEFKESPAMAPLIRLIRAKVDKQKNSAEKPATPE